jgi:hypothetical protein
MTALQIHNLRTSHTFTTCVSTTYSRSVINNTRARIPAIDMPSDTNAVPENLHTDVANQDEGGQTKKNTRAVPTEQPGASALLGSLANDAHKQIAR